MAVSILYLGGIECGHRSAQGVGGGAGGEDSNGWLLDSQGGPIGVDEGERPEEGEKD